MLIRSGWGESGRSLYSQARCWRNEVLQLGVRASGGTVRLNRNSLCVVSVQFRLPTTGKDMSRTGEANSLRECAFSQSSRPTVFAQSPTPTWTNSLQGLA